MLRQNHANTKVKGNQAFDFIGSQSFRKDAGELRAYKSGGNTFISGDTDGNGVADFTVKISGHKTFVDADFIL